MQHARRQDPYPITWEVPAGILLAFTVLVVLGLHVGRGVANLVAGGWWGFPDREHLFVSLPAFVGGDFAAGLARVEVGCPTFSGLGYWMISGYFWRLAV